MLETLRFRGPDERTIADLGGCILGNTRLSIIDLVTGSQPLYNEDRTIAAILNGEIYNYRDLRVELEKRGHNIKTTSDTEVIVHLYEDFGEERFQKLDCMFSIVLYDAKSQKLIAGRDRIGEKPLLYCDVDDTIIIASELKAILRHPGVRREIDTDALALYFTSYYVPAPYSIFKAIKKLPPAHRLRIDQHGMRISQYWQPRSSSLAGFSTEELSRTFVDIFARSVKQRMISDVPLGVFLSGGVDSSAVSAFMALQSDSPVKTFTIGFVDEIDERPYARKVAERYHTEHTEILVKQDIPGTVRKVLEYMDEPFADSSIVPTYVVAKEARQHVKVILTGDGGDELFAGYPSYIDQKYQRANRVTTKLFREIYDISQRWLGFELPESWFYGRKYDYASTHWHRTRSLFSEKELHRLIPKTHQSPEEFFIKRRWLKMRDEDPLSAAFEYDWNYYLPDDLLKKVDMASMFASLECRAPFLDHRLVEFSWNIPSWLKVKGDCLKYLLKSALSPYLPTDILHRPKIGFGAPIDSWLRNELRVMAADLLVKGCKAESFIDWTEVQRAQEEFLRPPKP